MGVWYVWVCWCGKSAFCTGFYICFGFSAFETLNMHMFLYVPWSSGYFYNYVINKIIETHRFIAFSEFGGAGWCKVV